MVGLIKLWPGLAAALLVAGCDSGASAVPVRQPVTDPSTIGREDRTTPASRPSADDPRAAPTPRLNGRPLWSANSRFTAQENAQRSFERNGAAFGAKTMDAYVARAHAFVAQPPKGAQVITRANGDRLIYDPAGNVFAVATRKGAPRTMFRPDEGAAYWDKVKAREANGGRRGRDDG
ncbi:MAG: hypothetical protein Q8L66_05445 [Caulobacter sp.]|nr:hypothetical protein [Caulobacter sp.]